MTISPGLKVPTEAYNDTASGTADGNGNVTINFQAPPALAQLVGMIAVTTPNLGTWQAYIDGQKAGQLFMSTNGAGSLTVPRGKKLVVKGTGLVPGNEYDATFTGFQADPSTPLMLPTPTAPSTAINSINGPVSIDGGPITVENVANGSLTTNTPQVVLDPGQNQGAGTTYNKTLPITTSIRAVAVIVKGANAGGITVTGNVTGFQYVNDTLAPVPAQCFVVPVFSVIDTAVNVVVTGTNAYSVYVVGEQEAVSSWVQSSDISQFTGQPVYVKNRTTQSGPTGAITQACPLGVLQVGGSAATTVTAIAASPVQVLPAPGGINPYRLHSIEWDGFGAGNSPLLVGISTGNRYFRGTGQDGFQQLGGMLVSEGLEVFFGVGGNVCITYDNVHVFGMNPWPPV